MQKLNDPDFGTLCFDERNIQILEHGLEVRFRNGYADESDQQGHLRVEIN